jgi:hypothetical protein
MRWRTVCWSISIVAGLCLIVFGPAALIAHTSFFNATEPQYVDFKVSCLEPEQRGSKLVWDFGKKEYSPGVCGVSSQRFADFDLQTYDAVWSASCGLYGPCSITIPEDMTTIPGGAVTVVQLHVAYPTLQITVMDLQGNIHDIQKITLPDVVGTQLRVPIGTDVINTSESLSRARLTTSVAVMFAVLLVFLWMSHQRIRAYLGKQGSPPRLLLYLLGLCVLMVPSSEQDNLLDAWIAEIAEAKGSERLFFAIDLLRVGPRMHRDMHRDAVRLASLIRQLEAPDNLAATLQVEQHREPLREALGDVSYILEVARGQITDTLYDKASQVAQKHQYVSSALLQRTLRLSYVTTAALIDLMHQRGLIGPADGAELRHLL